MMDDEDESYFEANITEEKQDKGLITSIPSLEYYEKTYGKNCEGNDRKAVKLFRNYEAAEKTRRLQNELIAVKEGKVSTLVLDAKIGKKRAQKYEGYSKWAGFLLIWLSEKGHG